MVGIQPSKADVDNLAGGLSRDLNSILTRVGLFKAWLDGKSVADLQAMNYTEAEANLLKSVVGDLDSLRRVATGAAATGAYDFMTFARQIYGFGM